MALGRTRRTASMSATEKLKAVWDTAKEWWRIARSNPARTMKLASSLSGALLIVGGISGVINIFNPLGIIISIYNMCAAAAEPSCPPRLTHPVPVLACAI